MYILENFWKLLLLVVVAVAGYFTWLRYDTAQEEKRLARIFAQYFDPTVYTSRSNPERFDEAYFQALAAAHRANAQKRPKGKETPLKKLVYQATKMNGLGPEYANAAHSSIGDALRICDEFGIFEDGGRNLETMDLGRPPTIMRGPYEGEPLLPAPVLNPLIEREGQNEILNMTLLPAPVRTLNALSLSTKSVNSATKMQRANILTPDRTDRVRRLARSYREKFVAEIKAAR